MKSISKLQSLVLISVPLIFGVILTVCEHSINSKDNSRDLTYESYCDSIYVSNPDYYLDVLQETDEYQQYIKEHGEWWNK